VSLQLGYIAGVPLEVRLGLGLLCSVAIGLFAWWRGSLSRSGALAAVAIGTSIFLGGGARWFLALFAFFATSTALGKVGKARKAALKQEFEKGDRRDAYQAFSNGGVAALTALGMLASPHVAWLGAFVGALATANGDTWATELGTLSRREPISLLSFSRVPRGTSGAVSPLGIGATAAGGALIGAILGGAGPSVTALQTVLLGLCAGVFGSFVDSVLGATVQAGYHCAHCARATEGKLHHCGHSAEHTHGFAWFDNDLVNLTATALGAGFGALWLTLTAG
jgi:uncharacterized protein (TIGR00297 family)